MNRLGIDQSIRSTGLCVVDENNHLLESILIQLDENKQEDLSYLLAYSDTMRKTLLFRIICEKVIEVCRNSDIEEIGIEGLGFAASGNVTRDLAGLQFMLLSALVSEGYTPDQITIATPSEVKKAATGPGGGKKKEDIFEALPEDAKSVIGQHLKTKGRYDLADAYWIATLTNGGSDETGSS